MTWQWQQHDEHYGGYLFLCLLLCIGLLQLQAVAVSENKRPLPSSSSTAFTSSASSFYLADWMKKCIHQKCMPLQEIRERRQATTVDR
jgi:hypothetical protein